MNYKFLLISALLLLPLLTWANTTPFTPLVGVPGLSSKADFSQYINALYILSISIAGLLAVIKMIIAGTKYMLSDVVTTKQDALGDIRGSILGLIIVISAVLVLQIINPQLVNLDVFGNVTMTKAPPPQPAGVAPPGGGVTPTTGNGYRWIPRSASRNDKMAFFVNCRASNGETNETLGDRIICYNALPQGVVNHIMTTFCPSAGGTPCLDTDLIKNLFQTRIVPNRIADTIPNSNDFPNSNMTIRTVYLTARLDNPITPIQSQLPGAMRKLCGFYNQAIPNQNISFVQKPASASAPGYVACVSAPRN